MKPQRFLEVIFLKGERGFVWRVWGGGLLETFGVVVRWGFGDGGLSLLEARCPG